MKRRASSEEGCGFSSVSAVKIRKRIDGSATARANRTLATWLALPSPSGSASTIDLPTRAMMASASRSAESNSAGRFPRRFMPDRSRELVPARVGEEALAVALREPHQGGADVGHAVLSRIVQRPAAERREAGREYHGAVDGVFVCHDALAQAGDADVEHRQDETVGHLPGWRRSVGVAERLAVLPLIEALAGLAAELALGDLLAQPGRDIGHLALETGVERLGDMHTDIEPDLVSELDRPDRHAEAGRGGVDGLALDAFVEQHHRLHEVGHQGAVDQEAGGAPGRRRQAIDATEEGAPGGQHLGRGLVVPDHLDELHARYRIEEVEADEALGARQSLAQLLERDARRIGGKDRVRSHSRLDRGIDVAFEVEHLR